VRSFLTLLIGATLLAGCAAKPTATSTQTVSAQEDKDRIACLEQPLKKESYDNHQQSFASCMRARGYRDDKAYATATTANPRKPLISDGLKNLAPQSSPEFAASEDYERAVVEYNDCVLEHTSNLSACEKQQATMNGLGKLSSRLPVSQTYQAAPRMSETSNIAGMTQGANTTNATPATLSQVPAPPQTAEAMASPTPIAPQTTSSRIAAPAAPKATSSRMSAPISLAPPAPSSLPAQISPPERETVVDHSKPVDPPLSDRPIPF